MSTGFCLSGIRIAYTDFSLYHSKYVCSVNSEFSQIEKHIMCYAQKCIEFLTSGFALRNFTVEKMHVIH
jgi:hypothetical protein